MALKPTRAAVAAGHTAGIFADMTLDGPEIGTLVVVVDRAKNLPNRKTMGKQDPYCAMRLGKEAKKTDTDRRGGQTPKWDQEIRFTVHDSPDYYKLKVSIFNDDKRTDLIGEAFISLADLIKPGGGSNDLWHQLNYKGKYAGDIRIEMTYYDMRPREEKPTEKRRPKEKTISGFGDPTSSHSGLSGPRQLGPRDIRRRPLPASPGQPPPSVEPQSQILPSQSGPHHPPAPSLSSTYNQHHHQQAPDQYPYHHDDSMHRRIETQPPYTQPGYQDPANLGYEPSEPVVPLLQPMTPEQFRTSAGSSGTSAAAYSDLQDINDRSQRRRSYLPSPDDAMDSGIYASSEHSEYFLPSTDVPVDFTQTEQVKPYHESPLRNAVIPMENSTYLDEEELELGPPPLPPKHQNTPRKMQVDYPPSSFAPVPLRPTPIRPKVGERSPLQNIEHNFDPNTAIDMQLPAHVRPIVEHTMTEAGRSARRRSSYGQHQQYVDEPSTITDQHSYGQPLHDTYQITTTERQMRRNSFQPLQQELPFERQAPPVPHRPRSYDDQLPHYNSNNNPASETYNSGLYAQSMPTLPRIADDSIRARPQKRMSGLTPPRKAVSPSPYQEDVGGRYPDEAGGRRLSGVPFGPAAYDVLNPASSEVTNENTAFETPEQARQSARLRESRAAEDIGPIVDNDGRVIDPSDHLPTSSWAPEPERKQRKPEHVIHYRTKNDGRMTTTPGSSPASLRMNLRSSQPVTPTTSSPMSAPPSSGRRQIHRPAPNLTRPLPSQPVPQSRVEQGPATDLYHRSTYQRSSHHESTSSVDRPALSEYQVPIQSAYTPRGSVYPPFHTKPERLSMSTGRCAQNFDDPLAAEMSMIDIGPPRGVRSGMRMSRGY